MNDEVSAPAEPTGASEQPAPSMQEAAKDEVGSLMSDNDFQADWAGQNGRKAQVAAVARKSQMHEQAFSDTPVEQPAPLPEKLQEGLDAQDAISKATAESLKPAETVNDFNFVFSNQENLSFEEVAQMHTLASEAAFAIGSNPHHAQETVKMLDTQMQRQDNVPSANDTEGNTAALDKMFGENAQGILDAASSALELMTPEAQDWLTASLDRVDASTRALTIGRLARTYSANN
jgi:hypothetical protein